MELPFEADRKLMATANQNKNGLYVYAKGAFENLVMVSDTILEDRVVFQNIRQFVMYLLSCNLAEIVSVGFAALLNLPAPLLPLQILFLNLVTDVFSRFGPWAWKGRRR